MTKVFFFCTACRAPYYFARRKNNFLFIGHQDICRDSIDASFVNGFAMICVLTSLRLPTPRCDINDPVQFCIELALVFVVVVVVVSEGLSRPSSGWFTPLHCGLHSMSRFMKKVLFLDLAIMHAVMQHISSMMNSAVIKINSSVECSDPSTFISLIVVNVMFGVFGVFGWKSVMMLVMVV